jgi:hypothetical protein
MENHSYFVHPVSEKKGLFLAFNPSFYDNDGIVFASDPMATKICWFNEGFCFIERLLFLNSSPPEFYHDSKRYPLIVARHTECCLCLHSAERQNFKIDS